jgi:hypothetical protein
LTGDAIGSVAVDSIVAGRGSLPVPILTDDGAIDPLPDLGVPVLYGEGVADIPGGVIIGGFVLPGSGGADHIVEGHRVGFVWYALVYRVRGPGPDDPVPVWRLVRYQN